MGDEVEHRKMMHVGEVDISVSAARLAFLTSELVQGVDTETELPLRFRVEADPDKDVPLKDAFVVITLPTARKIDRCWTGSLHEVAGHLPELQTALTSLYPERSGEISSWRLRS